MVSLRVCVRRVDDGMWCARAAKTPAVLDEAKILVVVAARIGAFHLGFVELPSDCRLCPGRHVWASRLRWS